MRISDWSSDVCSSDLLLLIFLNCTRPGLAIRAMAQNKESAGLMGVNVKRMSTLVYALYVGITSMAGVLVGAVYATNPQIGLRYTLFAFFVVVLAGLGSVMGVLASGLILDRKSTRLNSSH